MIGTGHATSFEPERVIEPIYTGGDVALTADGQLLASCLGEDVLLSNFATGTRLAKAEGDGEPVTSISLSPSGSHLVVCSRSLSMRIYSLSRMSELVSLGTPRAVKGHNLPIVKTTIDSTGTLLAAGASDGTVKVWDLRQGYTTHTLHGHGSVVSALCFVTTSKKETGRNTGSYKLAAGTEDGKLRVWNLETRKSAAFLDSHVSLVSSLAYDEDSHTLLSSSRDRTVTAWDTSDWQAKATIPVLELVESVGFLSSVVMYTAGENGQLRLWQTNGKPLTPQRKGVAAGILQTINHQGLSDLIAVHSDQVIRVHSKDDIHGNVAPKTPGAQVPVIRQISGTHDEIIDLAYVGQDHSILALATNVEEIRLLSLAPHSDAVNSNRASMQYFGADVGSLSGHDDIVICLDVDWSGYWLLSGAKDNTARLWRLDPTTRSFDCFATLTGHAESIGAVALPKGLPAKGSAEHEAPWDHSPRLLVTGSQDKTIKRWDVSSSDKGGLKAARALFTRKAHDKDINAVDINHNSTLFASASQDRTVKIWSAEDGDTVGVLRGHRRGVWSVRFSPKGIPAITAKGAPASKARGFALTGSGDRSVKIWSLSDFSCLRTFEGHTNSILKTVWMQIASTDTDSSGSVNGEAADEEPAAAVKRELQVASAGADGLVKVWDVVSGELATTLDNHTDRVWALALRPGTNGLVSGGGDGVMTFWKDTTSIKVAAAAAESTARIEQDQELQNFIRAGSYKDAIELALQLDHPGRLLGLFTEVTGRQPAEQGSICGVKAVDDVVGALSDEQLLGLLGRVRDWNANAKTAPVAQRVLMTVLRTQPPARLLAIRGGKGTSVKDVLDGLRVYTERHFARLEELLDESYLVEYTLQEMDDGGIMALGPANGAT